MQTAELIRERTLYPDNNILRAQVIKQNIISRVREDLGDDFPKMEMVVGGNGTVDKRMGLRIARKRIGNRGILVLTWNELCLFPLKNGMPDFTRQREASPKLYIQYEEAMHRAIDGVMFSH